MAFLGFSSFDALQLSIATRLGRGTTSRVSRDDLSPMIGELLVDEARNNERRIALFRTVLGGVYLCLALADRALGDAGGSNRLIAAAVAWTAMAAAFYHALRGGWYPGWLRRAVPVCDAMAIVVGALIVGRGSTTRPASHAALDGNAALLCAFLVFTGALRLTRVATVISSTLAVIAFVIVAIAAHLEMLGMLGVVAGLIGLSVLAGGVTEAVRRVVATEVGRLTMQRQVEGANARAAEAQAASTAREEVLRIVAHDLRNPLGTLLMAADLLSESSTTDDLRAKHAAMIKRNGSRMKRLIHDLLDVAQMETGRLSIDARPISPAVLVANAVELMRPLALEKTLILDEECPPGLPDVNADAERINQVFSNLIGNAIKFTPAGGRIVVRAEASDGWVWFSVTDTGPGIPEEQVDQVFGEFWQARKADRRGIGLGLTIAKGIVEAHGGKIGVSSEVGVGTQFWFGVGGGLIRVD